MFRKLIFFGLLSFAISGCVTMPAASNKLAKAVATEAEKSSKSCELDPAFQIKKSEELQELAKQDQAARAGAYSSINWAQVNEQDVERRIRVATIFAEGCLKSAADYAAAAIVFQHGTAANHFFQTFIWSNEAVKLGDLSQKWLAAAGLDRYLVKIGQKQLFGTQFSKSENGDWCLQPVEPKFPEKLRIEFVKKSMKEQIGTVLKGIGSSQDAKNVKECNPALKPTPKGFVPGFW